MKYYYVKHKQNKLQKRIARNVETYFKTSYNKNNPLKSYKEINKYLIMIDD
jgi:hypothetical protein